MPKRDYEYEEVVLGRTISQSKTPTIRKKRIHFILPGGGVNGAFQAGFLYRLLKDCRQYIDIERIDGISVGALNGIAMILEDPELIKTIWYSIESRSHIFDKHDTHRDVFHKKSIYNSRGLRSIIETHVPLVQKNLLAKFNCVVHNKTTKDYEYINGTHSSIWDYVTASASPPVISPYCQIGDCRYSDGGVDLVYPVDYVSYEKDDDVMNLIVGYYEETRYYFFKIYKKFKKSIEENMNITRKLVNDGHIHVVYNTCRFNIIDFQRKVIDHAFKLGEERAVTFYLEHIIQ
jgi:predicted acylesterase/phospholipase RssA